MINYKKTKGRRMLDPKQIESNISKTLDYLKEHNCEYGYFSSYDIFLNEYVPLEDNIRYYLSGFTGSVAELFADVKKGTVTVFVDGRYHEQADIECSSQKVEVYKVQYGKSVFSELLNYAKAQMTKSDKLAFLASRTKYNDYLTLKENFSLTEVDSKSIENLVDLDFSYPEPQIEVLSDDYIGESVSEKIDRIYKFANNKAVFLSEIDSVAWVTNLRAYQIKNSSALVAKALVLKDRVLVFTKNKIDLQLDDIEFYELAALDEFLSTLNINHIASNFNTLSASNFQSFESRQIEVNHLDDGILAIQSIKSEKELDLIRESFSLSDQVIFTTLSKAKDKFSKSEQISEFDLYELTNTTYKDFGAKAQSFNTIAGLGANSSIIHFSSPSKKRMVKEDEFFLLDSGGYFSSGFATDSTRTIWFGNKPCSKAKEIYTLVLKSLLQIENCIFKQGTRGYGLDAITRKSLWDYGYDFGHSTGHGVGIHVHEGGVGIGPSRSYELKENQVVSLEPGIYIPDFGGVRLENIAIVKKHPTKEGFLHFENLVYIDYEDKLIEKSLLTEQEKQWLSIYKDECRKRNRLF